MADINCSTPVLVLGGTENALSIARNLSRHGVTVRVSGENNCWGMYSRFCHESLPIPETKTPSNFWNELLLSDDDRLDGHILLSCSDVAIEFLANNRSALTKRYILDDFVPELMRAMLDKKKTLELARSVDVPTPNFWDIENVEDVEKIRDEVQFPVVVKPIHSHKFQQVFNSKLFIIENSFDELREKIRLALENDLEIMVVELIPGPDTQLCSYYTYVDETGRFLFDYTKRILRRYPANRGPACYHVTEWLPETAELGRKFFKGIGFRGTGNIEFKRDTRDGKLKVIEVNARFTAAQELQMRSGMPIDLIVYLHLTGQTVPEYKGYKQFLHYWYPVIDFYAFLEQRNQGKLSLSRWINSIRSREQVLPIFSLRDPWPAIVSTNRFLGERGRGLLRRSRKLFR